jgi:geranylgeranyl diphosphate synthase, type I
VRTTPAPAPTPGPEPAGTARPLPAGLDTVAASVDTRIADLLDAELARWAAIDPVLDAPLRSLRTLVLAGGKRLRPAFCHWAFVGAGGDPADPIVVDAGAGLEMLHTFALVHDDVMDASRTRRGMAAVHEQFITEHRSRGLRGEDRRFGEGVAILVGDLAFVYADILLRAANPTATEIFNELRIEVNIGQYLDLLGTVEGAPTVASAQRICRYKSGKYTIERPLHLGAALADAFAPHESALSAYGLPLGEAFQLRDDLLGALGETERTGKPVGDDLREGKPTALVARALEHANAAQRQVLGGLGDIALDHEQIAAIQEVLVDTGAAHQVESSITELRDEAIAAIRASTLSRVAVEALVDLALFVTDRDY